MFTCDGLIAALCVVPMAMFIRGYGYGYCYGNERGVIKTANCKENIRQDGPKILAYQHRVG